MEFEFTYLINLISSLYFAYRPLYRLIYRHKHSCSGTRSLQTSARSDTRGLSRPDPRSKLDSPSPAMQSYRKHRG